MVDPIRHCHLQLTVSLFYVTAGARVGVLRQLRGAAWSLWRHSRTHGRAEQTIHAKRPAPSTRVLRVRQKDKRSVSRSARWLIANACAEAGFCAALWVAYRQLQRSRKHAQLTAARWLWKRRLRLVPAAFPTLNRPGRPESNPTLTGHEEEEEACQLDSVPDNSHRPRSGDARVQHGSLFQTAKEYVTLAFLLAIVSPPSVEAIGLVPANAPDCMPMVPIAFAEGGELTHRSIYPDTVLELNPPWQQQRYRRWYETDRVLLEEARRMHDRDAAEAEAIQAMLEHDVWIPNESNAYSEDSNTYSGSGGQSPALVAAHIAKDENSAQPESRDVFYWRRLGVGAFVGTFLWWSHIMNVRNSNRVRLPSTYDPGAIAQYFALRPEQVALRTVSIISEAIWYIAGIQRDQLEYRIFGMKQHPGGESGQRAAGADAPETIATPSLANATLSPGEPGMASWTKAFRRRLVQIPETLISSLRKDETFWVWRRQRRAVLLRQTLERLGPAFVKLGQALATRPDIVGEAAARELQRLQDDLPHFPNEEAFRFIRAELGAPPNRVFDWISDSPVASASLGQVYKARLDGVELAVKVQRPGIVERIALDIHVVRLLGQLYMRSPWAPRTNLVEAIDEYASRLFKELDYDHEAKNMHRFRQLYGSLPGIYVPEVYPEYSSAHVLTMEWVNGRRLIDDTATVRREDIPLIKLGILCSLMQLMEAGFLHADPHTGNLLVTEDGTRLAYLDYGLMSEVPQSVQLSIICAVVHLINREYEQLATDFFGLTLMRRDDLDTVLPEFADALRETFESEANATNPGDFTLQGVAEKLLRMTVRFPFVMPPYFLNNLRALAILEGLALNADPCFRIMDIIYPYVVRRLLTDSSPQLQRALHELVLTPFGEPRWDRVEKLLEDAARTVPNMGLVSLDPRPVAVLELAAREAAEAARSRLNGTVEGQMRATTSAYFRLSSPELVLGSGAPRSSSPGEWSDEQRTPDVSLECPNTAVVLDDERRMQLLVSFITSPAGGFLRRALERQLADVWNDYMQSMLDAVERRLWPAVFREKDQAVAPTGQAETSGIRYTTVETTATPEASCVCEKTSAAETRPPEEVLDTTDVVVVKTKNGSASRRHRSGPRLTAATEENRRRLSQIMTHLRLRHWRAILGLVPVLALFYARVVLAVAWRVLERLGFDLGMLLMLGWRALGNLRPLALVSRDRSAQETSPLMDGSAADTDNGLRAAAKRSHITNAAGNGAAEAQTLGSDIIPSTLNGRVAEDRQVTDTARSRSNGVANSTKYAPNGVQLQRASTRGRRRSGAVPDTSTADDNDNERKRS